MKIFKFQTSSTACAWVRAEELAFVNVVNSSRFNVSLLGKYDDLANDFIVVTTTAGTGDVEKAATIFANHMQNKNMGGIVDVVAIDNVSATSGITPD